MRCLIWGAGAIGGTLGAYLARAGHDVTMVDIVVEHVDAINRDGLRVTGPIAEFTARVPAFTPQTLTGSWDTIVLATKAHHTERRRPRARCRTSPPTATWCRRRTGSTNSSSRRSWAPRGRWARSSTSAPTTSSPVSIHYGGHGAVVVGEIDGRITPRVTALGDAWSDFDPRAIVTPNIWGYLWGKEAYGAMLFATALTNESIADALAMPEYRPLYIALAREILAVAAARGVHARVVRRLRAAGVSPERASRRGGALARCAGRAQSALGKVAQRHLARSRRAQAAHRGGRAARHRRDARGRGRRGRRRSPRVSSS